MAMTKTFSLREARAQLGYLAEQAHHGETIVLTKHGRPYVQITTVPQEPAMTTYAYAIEVSDDREIWMAESDEAVGTEEFDGDPEKLANTILTNRLSDLESEGGVNGYIRVAVWQGEQPDQIGLAAAIAEPSDEYYAMQAERA